MRHDQRLAEIKEVDRYVKSRFVYKLDGKRDVWRSWAKKLRADPNFVIHDDCDGLAQTCIHELILRGFPVKDLFRCVVRTRGSAVPDHMIGLAKIGPDYYAFGDTFDELGKVSGRRVNGHTIHSVGRISEKMKFRLWSRQKPDDLLGTIISAKPRRVTNGANRHMQTSLRGIDLIKGHETFRGLAYDDARPNYRLRVGDPIQGTLTIGYGHTGPDVSVGQIINQEQAEILLKADLGVAENAVRQVKRILSQEEFDALVSFVFNVGVANFKSSTLLKKVNSGASDEAVAAQFRRWKYSTINGRKRVMGGLVRRREDEAELFASTYPRQHTFSVRNVVGPTWGKVCYAP